MKTDCAAPILSCAETKALEARLFGGDEAAEWTAMQAAGRALTAAMLRDFEELGGFPADGTVLVVVGKGHNGGDALLAAAGVLIKFPRARADVLLAYGTAGMRPLADRAWRQLLQAFPDRVRAVSTDGLGDSYALVVDGLFGFQFRPPLDERSAAALMKVNLLAAQMRAAVDLPSGLDAAHAFRADFTYATGVVKTPLLDLPNAGRLRYLDLGFFAGGDCGAAVALKARPYRQAVGVGLDHARYATGDASCREQVAANDRVLTSRVLDDLRRWRDPRTDKRAQGYLFVVAGSRQYPGAALMTVLAALRSGAGLVTAFVPESLVPAFAAQVPEAIWVGWPETPDGGLALEGRHLLTARLTRAHALVLGPGLSQERETLVLAAELVRELSVPVLLDADALQPEVVAAARSPLALTPHAGEYRRLAGEQGLRDYATALRGIVVGKGPVTRISAGGKVWHSLFGGPVLARGGSGDLLAGIIGAQLARTPADPLTAVCRGVVWHGLAADALAREHGAVAVRTSQLLDFLAPALRL